MCEQANPVPVFAEGVSGQAVQPFSPEECEVLNSYFERQSERLMEVFGPPESDDPESYLLNQSQKMMAVLAFMQLPWYKIYPGAAREFRIVSGTDRRKESA